MTYILQKKDYLFCQFSLKYVVLILSQFPSMGSDDPPSPNPVSKLWKFGKTLKKSGNPFFCRKENVFNISSSMVILSDQIIVTVKPSL